MPSISTVRIHTHTQTHTYYTHNILLIILYKHIVRWEGAYYAYYILSYILSLICFFSLSVSPWLCNFRSLLYWEIKKKIYTYACTYIVTMMYLVKLVISLSWCPGKPNIIAIVVFSYMNKVMQFFFVSFVVLFIFSHTLGIRSSRIIINVGHLETHCYDYYYIVPPLLLLLLLYIIYTDGTVKVGVIVSGSNGRISWCPLASNCEISGIH